jgi:hypothetical protein
MSVVKSLRSACRLACLACLPLLACDGATSSGGVAAPADGATPSATGAQQTCAESSGNGTVCSGGDNEPGLTGQSINNQGLIGNSQHGRGVYGSSDSSEGGYFSSTDGDGVLGYSLNGFSGHFTGGKGVMMDPPMAAGGPALTVNGEARVGLAAAPGAVIPVCGTLDPASGLFTLVKCDDRLDKLEAEVAALKARLGSADAGAP